MQPIAAQQFCVYGLTDVPHMRNIRGILSLHFSDFNDDKSRLRATHT
jgi:hypothetical protein